MWPLSCQCRESAGGIQPSVSAQASFESPPQKIITHLAVEKQVSVQLKIRHSGQNEPNMRPQFYREKRLMTFLIIWNIALVL